MGSTEHRRALIDGMATKTRWVHYRLIRLSVRRSPCAVRAPYKHIARQVWQNWLTPTHPEFEPRTCYSLQNCSTSAFQGLEPIPAYRAAASLGKMFN